MSTTYETEVQCDVCSTVFGVTFEDPATAFSATCPECDAHYPELHV